MRLRLRLILRLWFIRYATNTRLGERTWRSALPAIVLPWGRIELPHPCEHRNLNPACLPIPAPGQSRPSLYATLGQTQTFVRGFSAVSGLVYKIRAMKQIFWIALLSLALFTGCQRKQKTFSELSSPANAPAYTVGVDVNKSPAQEN